MCTSSAYHEVDYILKINKMSPHKLIQFQCILCIMLYYFATPIQPLCLMEHQILTKSKSLDDLKIDSNCPRRITLFQTGHKIQLSYIHLNRFSIFDTIISIHSHSVLTTIQILNKLPLLSQDRDFVIIFPTQNYSLDLHRLHHVDTLIPNRVFRPGF